MHEPPIANGNVHVEGPNGQYFEATYSFLHTLMPSHRRPTQRSGLPSTSSFLRLTLDAMTRVHVNHLLNFVVASQEDARSVVDVLRDDLEHPLHLTVDCLSASYSSH